MDDPLPPLRAHVKRSIGRMLKYSKRAGARNQASRVLEIMQQIMADIMEPGSSHQAIISDLKLFAFRLSRFRSVDEISGDILNTSKIWICSVLHLLEKLNAAKLSTEPSSPISNTDSSVSSEYGGDEAAGPSYDSAREDSNVQQQQPTMQLYQPGPRSNGARAERVPKPQMKPLAETEKKVPEDRSSSGEPATQKRTQNSHMANGDSHSAANKPLPQSTSTTSSAVQTPQRTVPPVQHREPLRSVKDSFEPARQEPSQLHQHHPMMLEESASLPTSSRNEGQDNNARDERFVNRRLATAVRGLKQTPVDRSLSPPTSGTGPHQTGIVQSRKEKVQQTPGDQVVITTLQQQPQQVKQINLPGPRNLAPVAQQQKKGQLDAQQHPRGKQTGQFHGPTMTPQQQAKSLAAPEKRVMPEDGRPTGDVIKKMKLTSMANGNNPSEMNQPRPQRSSVRQPQEMTLALTDPVSSVHLNHIPSTMNIVEHARRVSLETPQQSPAMQKRSTLFLISSRNKTVPGLKQDRNLPPTGGRGQYPIKLTEIVQLRMEKEEPSRVGHGVNTIMQPMQQPQPIEPLNQLEPNKKAATILQQKRAQLAALQDSRGKQPGQLLGPALLLQPQPNSLAAPNKKVREDGSFTGEPALQRHTQPLLIVNKDNHAATNQPRPQSSSALRTAALAAVNPSGHVSLVRSTIANSVPQPQKTALALTVPVPPVQVEPVPSATDTIVVAGRGPLDLHQQLPIFQKASTSTASTRRQHIDDLDDLEDAILEDPYGNEDEMAEGLYGLKQQLKESRKGRPLSQVGGVDSMMIDSPPRDQPQPMEEEEEETPREVIKKNRKEKTLEDGEGYKCPQCERIFKKPGGLSLHLRKHGNTLQLPHGTQLEEFVCDVEGCKKVFRKKENLKGHFKNNHSGIPRAPCPLCSRESINESALKTHLRKDHGCLPYKCECGSPFARLAEMRLHKKNCRMHLEVSKKRK